MTIPNNQTTFKSKIDKNATGLIMDVLAKLYNDPLAAAIREYVSNAVDANRKAGSTKTVTVNLPVKSDPNLVVRDYGNGLDTFDLATVYANFGTSDKRDDADMIGGFGIGSKSGLAISDKIDVVSWKNGFRNHFTVERTLDGIIAQVLEAETPDVNTPSGTQVTVRVQDSYISTDLDVLKQSYFKPLCGFKSDDVIATCPADIELAKYVNKNRIPDTWHEFKYSYTCLPSIDSTLPHHGFMVGDVFYPMGDQAVFDLDLDDPSAELLDISGAMGYVDRSNSDGQNIIIRLDMDKTKVNYSREYIDLKESSGQTAKNVRERIFEASTEIYNAIDNLKSTCPNNDIYSEKLMALGLYTLPEKGGRYANKLYMHTPNQPWILSPRLFTQIAGQTNWYVSTSMTTITALKMSPYNIGEYDLQPYDRLYVVLDDATKLRGVKTVQKVLQDSFHLYCLNKLHNPSDKQFPGNSATQYFYDYIRKMAKSKDSNNLKILFIHKSDLKIIPSGFRHHTVSYEELQEGIQLMDVPENPQSDKYGKLSTKTSAIRVYTLIDNANVRLEEPPTMPNDEAERRTIILSKDSDFAFNTRMISDGIKMVKAILYPPMIICANSDSDYATLKKLYPNAYAPSDNELARAVAEVLAKVEWMNKDKFLYILTHNIRSNNPESSNHKTINIAQYWNLPDQWYNSTGKFINAEDIMKQMHHMDYTNMQAPQNTEPWYKAAIRIAKEYEAIPKDTTPHKTLTPDATLLLTIVNSYTHLYKPSEIIQLLNNTATQYDYELSVLRSNL